MTHLPVDVLTEILLRLRAKSLLRFKSVCKLWYDLINDPDFIRRHVEQSYLLIVFRNPILHLSELDTFENAIELDYPFKNMDDDDYVQGSYYIGVLVSGSCRGLLCFSMDIYPYPVCLYNPTTQTHKILPFLPLRPQPPYSPMRDIYIGFGYDHVSQDYKCVRILQRNFDDEVGSFMSQVMVYSLKADSWRRGAYDVPHYFSCRYRYFVDFKGILHLLVEDDHGEVLQIVGFNLSDETFSSVSLPNYDTNIYMRAHIGVLDDCLCLMLNDLRYMDVWIMKEHGIPASWTRLFRVAKPNTVRDLMPISFSKGRKQLFVSYMVSYFIYKVACVDLETLEITDLQLPGFGKIWSAYVCSEYLLTFKDAEDVLAGTQQLQKKNDKRRRLMRKTERSLQRFVSMLQRYPYNY